MRIALTQDHAGPIAPRRHRRPRGFALLWCAAILLPSLGVAGSGLVAWRDIQADLRGQLERSVEMLRQHALRAFGMQEAILVAVARAIADREWEELRQDAALHGLLRDLVAAGAPLVRAVAVADDAHRLVAVSTEFPARPIDLSDRPYLAALRQGATQTVGEVLEARPTGWPAFGIARQAAPRPGETSGRGVLITAFSPEPLAAFYASVAEEARDVLALIRLDGAVLARHPPLPQGAATGPNPQVAAQLAASLARPPGAAPLLVNSALDGVPRLFLARQLGDWPVAVLHGRDHAAIWSDWRRRMLAPLASGLGATALLLALTGFAARGARRQQDAAERRMTAESRLAGASRAASIGLLAAGLAHDVKNLVQAVRSGARLIDQRAEDPAEIRHCAGLLAQTADRGGKLAEAMLAFARGGEAPGESRLEMLPALHSLAELLNRTLGSGWRIKATLPEALPAVRGDRAGFEAAVVNLAANARDAMPRGGTVVLAAWLEEVTEAPAADGLAPGRYVVTAVSDSGDGMPVEILARIGEPFFTTKPQGIGTGLGLATVRGFCERAGGMLRIDSEPGRGTTAALWLPAID
ncbi:ATP-binding protein [Falsiroseomonas sp.]|uniref:hybrid sensor histidine kinase/response regulator n=1 Tax=Falsiroseomonas sp. TaxID=2870721 RepID=UPI003F6FCD0A